MDPVITKSNTAFLCDSSDSLLVIVDMQERLSKAMPEKVFQQVNQNCQRLIQAASLLDIPIIITEQYPKGLGSTLTEIINNLPTKAQTKEKTCFSCASNKDFNQAVEDLNKKQIILVGMEAHVCILQTALELQQKNYQVFIAEDSICSRTKPYFKNAVQRLMQANCIITNVESIFFEWLRDAKHSHFKEISKLIK